MIASQMLDQVVSWGPSVHGGVLARLILVHSGSVVILEKLMHDHSYPAGLTEFRQPLQVQIHQEMPRILVQLGHIQRT